jgi:CubicO group peptidase (beta-lactamase class C family)
MHRRFLLAALAALSLFALVAVPADLPKGDPAKAGFDPQKLGKIGAVLTDAVAKKQIAGGVALVARDGKAVYVAAVGNRDAETSRPMTPDTIFRIASMTKPVTSVAAMILVDDGKIKLDDPLSKYIPEFAAPKVLVPAKDPKADPPYQLVPAKREPTVRDLLTHTSGISYRLFDPPHLGKLYADAGVSDGLAGMPETVEENVKRLARLPLLHQPGERWTYGLNTDVLGRVVEVASAQRLDDFFRRRIFGPLKMDDTHFALPEHKRDRLAALYAPGDDKTIRRVGDDPVKLGELIYSATYPIKVGSRYTSGGAGLVSTAGDYARFLQMLLNRGELDGLRLLKPETVDAMTRGQIGDLKGLGGLHGDTFGYGFAVVTEGGKADRPDGVGSYSWGGLFYTYFWVDPQNKLLGVLMTQVYPNNHLKLREEFHRLTYEALVKP